MHGVTSKELTNIAQWFDAVFDLTTTELVDEECGGVLSAGSVRLTSAGNMGIPQVVSLGALDMVGMYLCNYRFTSIELSI